MATIHIETDQPELVERLRAAFMAHEPVAVGGEAFVFGHLRRSFDPLGRASVEAEGQHVQAVRTEWDGAGLPPVGTVCEVQGPDSKGWGRARIQYQEKAVCVWRWLDSPNPDQIDHAECPDRLKFRPIRTAEQIAAEEQFERLVEWATEDLRSGGPLSRAFRSAFPDLRRLGK